MKKRVHKTLSLLVCAAIFLSALSLPLSALDFVAGANDVSDMYKASEYYKKLTSLTLTGDGRTDVVAVALSQLGYTEGNEKNDFSGTAGGKENYTEYNYNMGSFGSGYGGVDYPWCASFVSFCLLQAEVHSQTKVADWCRKHEGDSDYIYREVSCSKWAKQLRTCGYFNDSHHFGGDYLPIAGDLIYFTENGITESHIGIVLYTDQTNVYTVEGNTSAAVGMESNGDGVYLKSYPITSSYIRGYGVLPYKVNNNIPRIDYSGETAGLGRYIATVTKYIYPSETASTYDYLLPKNSIFTVTEVTKNGRLKIICEIDGKTVEGYVKNNSDRVIQISSSEKIEGYPTLVSTWGYIDSHIEEYTCADERFAEKREMVLKSADTLGIVGSASLSREIASFGYYFDDDIKHVLWDEDAVTKREGRTASYEIEANVASVASGKHAVHFVLGLSDGTVSEIDSIPFILKADNSVVVQAPKILDFDDSSVTLMPTEGYEYKLFDGEWQNSNVFAELDSKSEEPLLFYQRNAETETQSESKTSAPLTVYFKAMNDASKLDSLMLDESVPLPSFDPDVYIYDVSIEYPISNLTPIASAKGGAKVTIDVPPLVAGEVNEIKISVECEYGRVREYLIRVKLAAVESEIASESISESVAEATTLAEESLTETYISTETEKESTENYISCASSLGIYPLVMLASISCLFIKKIKNC